MRPAEFANEEVIKAGKELQAVGRSVTGFALRQKIGGGNATRLRQVWDEYVNSQSVVSTEQVAELPIEVAQQLAIVTAALTDRLTHLATELNDKAVRAAERRVSEVVKSASAQRAAAERELSDAGQTVEDLELRLDTADSELQTMRHKLDLALAQLQKQEVELATAKGQIFAANASMQVLQTQFDNSEQQRLAALSALNESREDAARKNGHMDALQNQIKVLLAKLEIKETK